MEKVTDLLKEISESITQTTSSKKDEVRVMRAMLNDTSYEVGVYDKNGEIGKINPSQSVRGMVASAMSGAAKISTAEAQEMMEHYEFKRAEAEALVDVSKEFVHTYIHSGRKLPLGGREKSDISVCLKPVEAGKRTYPKAIGTDKNGNKIYACAESHVNAYESMKVYGPCPQWTKD